MANSDWATSNFTDIAPQSIAHQPLTGRDAYGKPTYGASTSYPVHMVYKQQRVAAFSRTFKGEGADMVSSAQAIILGLPSIKYDDKLTLPDGTTPVILSVERHVDEVGDAYVKVLFGSANG